MRKKVLNRYERDAEGGILIDVAAEKAEHLYNDFDKRAPYIRRDLDQDLVDYLIECAREVGDEAFRISFTLVHLPDDTGLSRIRRSIHGFFMYLADVERHKIRRMIRRSMVFFSIGIAILFLSVWVNRWLGSPRTDVANVFAQGLTVAAWVSLWEALATFLVDWSPSRQDIKLYHRLASCQTVFRASPEARPDGDKAPQSPDGTAKE